MRNHRGQASILIAIIFQILFVFFAMVVNVGLLVHDKINLQNSVDIAAYYGAMKQAEVLNAMAQLNYQIRQAYKLMNWRLWVMADAGRNSDFNGPLYPQGDIETWPNDGNPYHPYPVVCVANTFWKDSAVQNQNLCKKVDQNIPKILPIPPTALQTVFVLPATIFSAQLSQQADEFNNTFNGYAPKNYAMAARIYASYKIAVARRRYAIKQLQDFLIKSADDFKDIDGQSVSATVINTLRKNLSASNLGNNGSSLDQFTFTNSLGGHPFMVPMQIHVLINYEDFPANATSQGGKARGMDEVASGDSIQSVNNAKEFWAPDYIQTPEPYSADQFKDESTSNMSDGSNTHTFYSLVGFEKSPWVLAYVSVKATTHPKMLFSPLPKDGKSQITLTAESYAMPFGGKMGPWFYTKWPKGSPFSVPPDKIDQRMPDRIDQAFNSSIPPNYSRYPGDPYGMQAREARTVAKAMASLSDYNDLGAPGADPIVENPTSPNAPPPTRILEMAAVAPDIFDAAYYSVEYNFRDRFLGHENILQGLCKAQANVPCLDLGSTINPAPAEISVSELMDKVKMSATTPDLQKIMLKSWKLIAPEHLNTSWSQGDPGEYDASQAQKVVGQKWWATDSSRKPMGGRAGYSVKIVSKQFLQSPLPLGGDGNAAPIDNIPQ